MCVVIPINPVSREETSETSGEPPDINDVIINSDDRSCCLQFFIKKRCEIIGKRLLDFIEVLYYILKYPIIIVLVHYLGKFYIIAYCSMCDYDIPKDWGWNDWGPKFILQFGAGLLISAIIAGCCVKDQ
jgi:hypothetical protein